MLITDAYDLQVLRCAILVHACLAGVAAANGRPPASNAVFFKPGDPQSIYVATTFGLLASTDACHFYWFCEQDIGIGGGFDPHYGVTAVGTIIATTFSGVRISRDGGCSFTTQLGTYYTSGLAIGPTGDVWVGTSDAGSGNAVFVSHDDGASFDPPAATTTLPGTMWFRSLAAAPSDPSRVYVSGYQVSAGAMPPSTHLFRTDDHGVTWVELAVTGLTYANQPTLDLAAVDPTDPNIVYLISRLASPPYGDILYRSDNAGATIAQVLATASTINGTVVRQNHVVDVTTQNDGLYESSTGTAFSVISTQLQFGCLGERSDGTLFACASNYEPDYKALASSHDGVTWAPALQFEYLTGPLDSCAIGTAEQDICAGMFDSLGVQLGKQDSQCSTGSGSPVPDAGVRDIAVPPAHRATGCCGAAPARQSIVLALLVLAWTVCRRRNRTPR